MVRKVCVWFRYVVVVVVVIGGLVRLLDVFVVICCVVREMWLKFMG